MATRKKRTKQYSGADANRTTVTRYKAVQRSSLQQWLHENRQANKTRAAFALIAFAVSWIIYAIIS